MKRNQRQPVTVDAETLASARAFAAEHGADWKLKLSGLWARGAVSVCGAVLYRARNTYGSALFAAYDEAESPALVARLRASMAQKAADRARNSR